MQNYHIYEAIGRGKSSVVYKGRMKKSIQYFAVKSVEKHARARVLQEVQVLRAFQHDNVLKFFAWYETQNHLWLILEYCVGGDLMSLLRQVRLRRRDLFQCDRPRSTDVCCRHDVGREIWEWD